MQKNASQPIQSGASRLMRKFKPISLGFLLIFAIITGGAHNADAATKIIAFTENSQQNSARPQILVIGETSLHIVFQAMGDIFALTSTDSGGNFTDATNISNSGEASSPQIAASGNSTLFVVWEQAGDVFLTRSTDSGGNFTDATNISNSGEASSPQIAASGNSTLFVVWEQAGDVFLTRSTDSGGNFTSNEFATPDESSGPDVAVLDDVIFIVWLEFDSENSEYGIAYQISEDGGSFFADEVTLIESATEFSDPSISSAGAKFFVTWEQYESDLGSIFVAENDDLSNALLCPVEIGQSNDHSANPQFVANGVGDFFSVWEELVTEGDGDEVVFASELDLSAPSITQRISGNQPVIWGLEEHSIIVSGIVGNYENDDVVMVDWGDDSEPDAIPASEFDGCTFTSEVHIYDSGAVGGNDIVSSLKESESDSEVRDSTDEFTVQVLPHNTELVLEPVSSVQVGDNLTVTGILSDLTSGGFAEGVEITFDGTGAAFGLSNVTAITDVNGTFVATAAGHDEAESRLKVQAHFDGTGSYTGSQSEVRLFNVAGANATSFDVPSAGESVSVVLTDFNATIQFEEILEAGEVFVEECVSLDTARFLSLEGGVCLVISPGLPVADGSDATITMSYHDQSIADGFSENDIDMFLEDPELSSSYLDISMSRDLSQETVTGKISSFGSFILGLAIHDAAPDGALRKQAFIGEDVEMQLRDTSHAGNDNATITLDESSYRLTETATLTIEDKNADLDPTEIDTISAFVVSETSAPSGVTVPLNETGVDSGIFGGSFSFKSTGNSSGTTLLAAVGDELSVTYNQTNGPRFKAILSEVVESGVVDVYGVALDPAPTEFSAIGYAVAISLVDTQLISAGNEINVTLSYANADLAGANETLIQLYHGIDVGGGVINWDPPTPNTTIDTENKTVTAPTSLLESAGFFVLGYEEDSPGGEGGGLGSTEPVEITIPSIASIRSSSSGGGGGGGGGGSGGGSSSPPSPLPGPTGSTTAQLSQPINSETGPAVEFDVPGHEQNLQVDFENIMSTGGTLVVTVTEISQLPIAIEGSNAMTIGDAYDIKPSPDLFFGGLVYVTLPYDESEVLNSNSSESDVRALHFDSTTGWEDKTVSIDMVNNTVTAALSSFSPILVAIMEDGSYGPAYIEANPLASISASNPVAFAMQEGESEDIIAGEPVDIRTTIKNMERNIRSYTYIVQVLDSNGQVVSLDLADTGSLARSQEKHVTSSGWTPTKAGEYTVMIFIWEQNLQSNAIPTPLAPKMLIPDLTVIEALDAQ